MNEKRREIKMPASQMWREFRMRFLPMGVFLMALVGAFFLWQQAVLGPTMIGSVETIQTYVTAPMAGQVTNLLVHQFQIVKKDEPIAEFISSDFRAVSRQLQDLRSRIAM